jgi:hypothetical protein
MNTAPSPVLGELASEPPQMTAWTESLAAYERLRHSPHARADMLLEATLESLYAQACAEGSARAEELADRLAQPGTPAVASAWRALLALGLAHGGDTAAALAALDAALDRAPPRSAWLIASEAARLTVRAVGPRAAWARIAAVEPVPAAEPWLDEGPLVIHALIVKLRLAATTGNWAVHDALIEPACARFGSDEDPRALRIRLAGADHDVMRGCYERAARVLDRLEPGCRGDLRFQLLAVRLHALVACAAQQRQTRLRAAIERTLAELAEARAAVSGEAHRLPADERADLVHRVEALAEHAGIEAAGLAPVELAAGSVGSLARALAAERDARREQSSRPALDVLAALLPRVEDLLQQEGAAEHREDWIRLRLLWCRLVVDLGDTGRYPDCELWLGQIIEETTQAGLLPLAMAAHDQRAVLYAQPGFGAWDLALADAGQAGALAVRLLAENASSGGGDNERIMGRALLGTLLPVLDRVIDLLLGGAHAIEAESGGSRATWDRARRERWQRFGRSVHDYVEQSQVLALKEARRAYGAADTPSPHRFALVAPGQEPESPLPRLRRALRRRDAVLQYFVTGRYVVVFFYGRRHFDWALMDAVTAVRESGAELEAPTAHAGLMHLLAGCDAWLKGESSPEHEASAAPLRRLLLSEAITERIEGGRLAHVRIVPHDVLYRVPFGRLRWNGRMLLERVSLSLHPTAGLAAESAAHRPRSRRARSIGYVFEPGLHSSKREEEAIRRGLGAGQPLVSIDTAAAQSTEDVARQIAGLDVLHLACHGGRPVQRREAFLKLGTGHWKLSQVASLHMRQCALAILQSCWTGWLEHERVHPVQGFPQALCDAGVGAVIAPLVKVPDTLTPIFGEVLYRALRFLPAEQALRATLDVLREHGAVLLADDPEASRDFREYGSHDTLEYRYVGHTNLHLGGGLIARLTGRLSFWRWRRRLRRNVHAPPRTRPASQHGP